jgi:hypothetical protein
VSDLDYKSEAEQEKVIVDNTEKPPRNHHKVVSDIYFAVIILCIPVVFCSLTYGNDFAVEFTIAALWAIGSIIVSKILINKKNTRMGYLVLYSVPLIVWLFLVRDTW